MPVSYEEIIAKARQKEKETNAFYDKHFKILQQYCNLLDECDKLNSLAEYVKENTKLLNAKP